MKRDVLGQVIQADPAPEHFEAWLLAYAAARVREGSSGSAWAMAQSVLDEWRLAHVMPEFAAWLAQGAPSEDRLDRTSSASP